MYPIEIHSVLNGFVVKVGCQLVVYRDKEELKLDFANYIENPSSMERKFMEKNEKIRENPVPCMSSPPQCEAPQPLSRIEGLLRR